MRARAMVQLGPGELEEQELEVPVVAEGEALLKIEATGICGSDKTQLDGGLAKSGWSSYPVIPGHEPVGRIVEIGAEARRLWGVEEGRLVAVESVVPCQVCDRCTGGQVVVDFDRRAAAVRDAADRDPVASPVGGVAAERVLPDLPRGQGQVEVRARVPRRQDGPVRGFQSQAEHPVGLEARVGHDEAQHPIDRCGFDDPHPAGHGGVSTDHQL